MARRVVDHRTLLNKKKNKTKAEVSSEPNTRWWTLTGQDAANGISSTLTLLFNNQHLRRGRMLKAACLYGNLSVMPFALNGGRYGSLRSATPGSSGYNIVQSAIDAITSKIAKSKPEPYFLTSGGNFHQQRRAQKLTDYISGVFYENEAHALAVQTFRDACIWGSGVVHVFAHNGRVKFERVMPAELYIDEVEGFYRKPRQMHRVKAVDRQLLIDAFPDHAAELANASPAQLDDVWMGNSASDLLQVRESWHLRSGPKSDDGRHMITVGDLVLLSEEWTRDSFPFAKLDWAPQQWGYWGQGATEQIEGFQTEINQLSWVASRSFYRAGTYKVFNKIGSKVVKEHLNNEVGAIIDYAGDVPPTYVVPPIISPQHLERIEALKQAAYEQLGVSQLSAASQKPAGLNSGKALREMTDIESDRFQTVAQAYEKFFLDLASLSIAVCRELSESGEGGSLRTRTPGKKSIKAIDWAQCEMDEEEYVTKGFPVSALPNEPAGRLQTVQEYVQGGMISASTARRLLDFPDLQAIESLENAQQEYLHMIFDKIVDDGEYTAPDSTDDLSEARRLALQYLKLGQVGDLEAERQQMLREFLDQVTALEQEAAQPPPSQAPTPQAQPMAPPRSDLVQNQPGIQQAA